MSRNTTSRDLTPAMLKRAWITSLISATHTRLAPPDSGSIFDENGELNWNYNFWECYDMLAGLVATKGDLIATRWQGKKVAQRAKTLTRAWESTFCAKDSDKIVCFSDTIPEKRALIADKSLGVSSEKDWINSDHSLKPDFWEVALAFINLEQLTPSATTLLKLIGCRANNPPHTSGRVDALFHLNPLIAMFGYDCTSRLWNAVIKEDVDFYKYVTIVDLSPDGRNEYGNLEKVHTNSRRFRVLATKCMCMVHEEADILFRFQKSVNLFCLYCVLDILGTEAPTGIDKGLFERNYGPGFADRLLYVPGDPGKEFITASAYWGRLNGCENDVTIASASAVSMSTYRHIDDTILLLRTDKDFFLHWFDVFQGCSNANILVNGKLDDIESSCVVDDTLKRIVFHTYSRRAFWNNSVQHLKELIACMDYTSTPEDVEVIGRIGEELLTLIQMGLKMFLQNDLRLHGFGEPFLQKYMKRTRRLDAGLFDAKETALATVEEIYAKNPLYGMVMTFSPPNQAHQDSMKLALRQLYISLFGEEVEYMFARDPKLKSTASTWLMWFISDVAVYSEISYSILGDIQCENDPLMLHATSYTCLKDATAEMLNKFSTGPLVPSVCGPQHKEAGAYDRLKDLVSQPGGLEQVWKEIDAETAERGIGLEDFWTPKTHFLLEEGVVRGRWHGPGSTEAPSQVGQLEEGEINEDDEPPKEEAVRTYSEWNRALLWVLSMDKAPPVPEIAASKSAPPTPSRSRLIFSERVLSNIRKLASGMDTLPWKEFTNIMRALKFSQDHIGGCAYRFMPDSSEDEAIIFYCPVEGKTDFNAAECRWMWKRLVWAYGWELKMFEDAAAAEAKAAGCATPIPDRSGLLSPQGKLGSKL